MVVVSVVGAATIDVGATADPVPGIVGVGVGRMGATSGKGSKRDVGCSTTYSPGANVWK
jgi:hypothetical protein